MVKRSIYILLSVLFLIGCEVIPEAEQLVPVSIPSGTRQRTHLLIEYTGFRCVNCPSAAEIAQNLAAVYDPNLIVVAMHPASNPFTQGLYDYTCPAADTCYQFMGGLPSTPFPKGNIDFFSTEKGYLLDPAEWTAQLNTLMRDTIAPFLSSKATIDTITQMVHVTCYMLSDTLTSCRLAVWLVEDSIPGAQAMPDGSVNTNYIHRHVLRGTSEHGLWGMPVTLESHLTESYTAFKLPQGCLAQHCSIVALLLDDKQKNAIQTYETKLDNYCGHVAICNCR